jgi:hypothetical protein
LLNEAGTVAIFSAPPFPPQAMTVPSALSATLWLNPASIAITPDRLFGTFQKEKEKAIYGITTNIHTYNLLKIASHEYFALMKDVIKAPGLMNKLKYIFMPPGWSHDGSTKTAVQLRHQQNTTV